MKEKVKCTKENMPDLYAALKRIFGFDSFKGNQEEIIHSVLSGQDTLVIMPTGGGKSLCYQLPAFLSEGTAIIVSPLISLMKNQVDAIRGFCSNTAVAHFLNSSLSRGEIVQVKEDLRAGKTKLLYVAPESLTKEENVEFLKSMQISFFAIDEAHCISEWGHDFRPEYRRLRPIIDAFGKTVPIIALTATATPKVQHDIVKTLKLEHCQSFISSFDRKNLFYEIRFKQKDDRETNKEIIRYINNHKGKSGIIYCLSRKRVEELSEILHLNGVKALPYHAGLDTHVRANHQDQFLNEDVDVIVATIAFGMGIDKPDVRFVIHYDMPKSLEGYYQETGRAGRDEGEGHCMAFYCEEDVLKFEKFLKDKPVAEQEVARQLMSETVSYAESSLCRRVNLLHYFGEKYTQENCGSCDNCVSTRPSFEATESVVLAIETVLAIKQLYKTQHLVNIIMGVSNSSIKSFRHDQLPQFGAGAEEDEFYWKAVIRQAVLEDLLIKDIESYGVLKVTEKGKAFIKKPKRIMVKKDHRFKHDDQGEDEGEILTTAGSSGFGGGNEELLAMLRDLRKTIAQRENLPPYVIFEDRSLEDMTIRFPIDLKEMEHITGVGVNKSHKYGEPFVEVIKNYVEDHEIERPQDLVVKSIINKSGLKVYIIKSIDQKFDLEDIAITKNLDLNELLSEMERIVASGTKLDIRYYIEEFVDPYHQEDLLDYFRSTELENMEEILADLGEDEYSEAEIRLMRILFLAEYGQ